MSSPFSLKDKLKKQTDLNEDKPRHKHPMMFASTVLARREFGRTNKKGDVVSDHLPIRYKVAGARFELATFRL